MYKSITWVSVRLSLAKIPFSAFNWGDVSREFGNFHCGSSEYDVNNKLAVTHKSRSTDRTPANITFTRSLWQSTVCLLGLVFNNWRGLQPQNAQYPLFCGAYWNATAHAILCWTCHIIILPWLTDMLITKILEGNATCIPRPSLWENDVVCYLFQILESCLSLSLLLIRQIVLSKPLGDNSFAAARPCLYRANPV